MSQKNFDRFFSSWNEGETGYFKVGSIELSVTGNAADLERAAKETAKEIEAEVSYAWDLGNPKSSAWWLEWGGFSLEEEIPYHAAISLPEVVEKVAAFDPADNDFECASIEEFKEMMFAAHDEELTAEDLKRGFHLWLDSLEKDTLSILQKDLESWTSRAR